MKLWSALVFGLLLGLRLIGTAAVSQLQWSTPLEKKPRPVQR